MQGHDFIFCLTDRPGTNPNFWGIDANGKAKLSATPYFLQFSPDGWLDLAIQNIRNKKYWGVDRMVTIPFGYVEDGARMLKTIFYTFGPETPVYLKVCRQVLDYTEPPNGVLEFTAGQSPFTANGTATGTITAKAGSTVNIKLFLTGGDPLDSVSGNFGTTAFSFDATNPTPTYSVIVPANGIVDFSVLFTQTGGSSSTAGMGLVNATGDAAGSWGFWYKQIYMGQVDLSSFNHKGSKVTVATLEDGLPKFLKANEGTVIELPMNVPEAIYWKADGIILRNKGTFFVGDGQGTATANRNHVVNLDLVAKEFEDVGDVFSTERRNVSVAADLAGTQQHFHKATLAETVVIDYDFQLDVFYDPPSPTLNPAAELYVQIAHVDASGAVVSSDTILHKTFIEGIPGSHKLAGTITTNVAAGHRLFLWTYCTVLAASGDEQLFFVYTENTDTGNQSFIVTYKSRFATTYIRCLRPQYIFTKVMEFLSEGAYTVDDGDGLTNYFGQNNHYNKPFTCGNAIRGFDDAVMKISWNIFFQFWDCFDAVGIMPKASVVTFDRKKNLIDFTSSISLGEVSNMGVILDKEKAFNELAVGYPEIKNEAGMLNGNDAFNCGFLFSMGTSISPAKLEKIAQVKTDPYEMEQIRITTANRTSTDFKNDNSLYAVHLLNTLVAAAGPIPAHYELDRTLNPFATGITEAASLWNIIFSPKRNILRMGDWLRSCLFLQDWKVLQFRSADKNSGLITTQGLVTIEERAPVNIGELDAPFFLPLLISVEAIAPFNLLELLDANPLQLFNFDFNGDNYKGIMVEVGIAPGTEKEQNYKFLPTADNDVTKLIEYFG